MPEEKTKFELYEDGNSWDCLADRLPSMEKYKQFRNAIDTFINENFVEDVHHGAPYKGTNTRTLLQPGAQMLSEFMSVKAMYFPDIHTWDMLGKSSGTVCYTCYLVPQDRLKALADLSVDLGTQKYQDLCKSFALSEGRAAGNIKAERASLPENSVVKKVQKRAFVDAVMRLGGLYSRYTQDMEEMHESDSGNDVLEDSDSSRAVEATDDDFLSDDELPARDLDSEMGDNEVDTDDLFY